MYLIFIHCKFKFEKHKQTFLSENYEQIFPNKKKAHEKHKRSFPSENYNRARHGHARTTSADSIPPHSLWHRSFSMPHSIVMIGRSQLPRGLRRGSAVARCWDCGFETRREHGCLSVLSVVCCQVEVSASG